MTVLDTSGHNYQLLYVGNSPGFIGNIIIGNGSANSGWVQQRSNAASPFGAATITINGGGVLSADTGTAAPTTLSNNIILNTGGTLGTQARP